MGIASKGPRIVLWELSRGRTVSGQEVVPRLWASFQGSIESQFSGNFQALIPS
ncbi:hypothetical protein F2Q70_00039856 [Brassica cretica]|uniref:Uncharacterized protein n=1 Tax=Brassica cretica TaxID=69181 RepID=A0A8S9K1Y5_BRACR|nr:hypothetical protein F2Q70_00039856 [Brassica cretica]